MTGSLGEEAGHLGTGLGAEGAAAERDADLVGEVEGGLAVFEPGTGAGVAEVDDAAGLGIEEEGLEEEGEVAAIAGAAPFVGDGAALGRLLGALDDGVGKAGAVRAVNPGGTGDEEVGVGGEDGLFGVRFGAGVDAEGEGGVGFAAEAGSGAVVDVVGAEVNEAGAAGGAKGGDVGGASALTARAWRGCCWQ